MVLLKRLPDALRDGDRILAVVRGTALNNDGRTVNITTPSQPLQAAAYQAALAAAGVDANTVGMVEAHGTGTPTGDPIEFGSLAEVYGIEGPCALAASKTNFGHTQSASGTLGLMKAVLAVQHGVVPQNLHFTGLPDELARITDQSLCAAVRIRRGPTTVTSAPAGGGVGVRVLGNQCPRHRGASSRDPRNRCTTQREHRRGDDGPAAVRAVVDLGRRTAPHRRPAGRLGAST